MRTYLRPGKLAVFFLAAAVLTGAAVTGMAQATGQPKNETIEGTLSGISRDTLAVTLPDGSVKPVMLLPDSLVLGREPATLDSIKPNDAVGVASRRESDGSLTADYINIFSPELWNVVRKGTFPMESGDLMSNAVVTEYVAGVQGRVLTLKYQGETTAINVPENTRINRLITEKVNDLTKGTHIIVRATVNSEGYIVASSVIYNVPSKGAAAGQM
jgi:hypothetical protein